MTDLTSVPRWTESGMSSTPMCTITEVSKSAGSALKWALKCKMHTLLASYIMVSRQVLVVAAKINLLLTWAEKIQKGHLHFCLSRIYSVISSCVHFSKEQATLKELNEPCHLLPPPSILYLMTSNNTLTHSPGYSDSLCAQGSQHYLSNTHQCQDTPATK